MNRFEMSFQSDMMVDGNLKKVWWVRAKYGHTMPVRCPRKFLSIHFFFAYPQDRESILALDE